MKGQKKRPSTLTVIWIVHTCEGEKVVVVNDPWHTQLQSPCTLPTLRKVDRLVAQQNTLEHIVNQPQGRTKGRRDCLRVSGDCEVSSRIWLGAYQSWSRP